MGKLAELRDYGWSVRDIDELLRELREKLSDDMSCTQETGLVHSTGLSMAEEVEKVFKKVGIPFNIKGRAYLKEAILYRISNYRKGESLQMHKELYPHVAKEFDTTPSRVERAIRHAIERMYDYNSPEIEKILGNCTDPRKGKATNSEAIAAFVNYLT